MSTDELRCDQELWEAALIGEVDAFGELFERHHVLVYNFCFRRTASWSTAEDLMAVVFLEAWRTRRGMQLHEGSLLPWLYAIATNVTRHQHRSTGRHRAALARVASRVTNVPDHAEGIIDRISDEQRMRQVLGAFTQLPQRERTYWNWPHLPVLTMPKSLWLLEFRLGPFVPDFHVDEAACGSSSAILTNTTTKLRRRSHEHPERTATVEVAAQWTRSGDACGT